MHCDICGQILSPDDTRCSCCGTVRKKEEKSNLNLLRCIPIVLAAALFFLPGSVSSGTGADLAAPDSMSIFGLLQSLFSAKTALLFALGAMLVLLAAIFCVCKKKSRRAAALLALYGGFILFSLFIGGYRLHLTPSCLCLAQFGCLALGTPSGVFE